MSLEIATNKTPGAEIRVTEADRPPIVGLMIVALTVIEFVFVYLIIHAIFVVGANSAITTTAAVTEAPLGAWLASDQRIISLWLSAVFFCFATIILLYQRYFMDHVTIAKRRFRKWEDEGVQLHG